MLSRTMAARESIRIVLLGKTGVGKSSLGNTLLGRDVFRLCVGMASGTQRSQWADADLGDLLLEVTDTPGVCDTHRPEDEVLKEIGKSVALCLPGPHAILMVLRSDRRFTEEEYQAYQTLKRLFGPDLRQHMIIVFTAIDNFKEPTVARQRQQLDKHLRQFPRNLQEVLDDAGGRYIGINNLVSRQAGDTQSRDLIRMMTELMANNNGQYYSNRVFQEVNSVVAPVVEREMQNRSRDEALRHFREDIAREDETVVVRRIINVVHVHTVETNVTVVSLCSVL